MTTPSTNKNKKMRRLISLSVMAAVSATASAWIVSSLFNTPIKDPVGSNNQPNLTTTAPQTTPKPEPQQSAQAPVKAEKVQIYWVTSKEVDAKLVPASIEIQTKSTSKTETLAKAFEVLLAGPKQSAHVTTIPEGTKLISLKVTKDGVHVNLSEEFTSGGGSSDMSHRLAQVLYTATSIGSDTPVWLSVDGKPLESLGGEGLMLAQPMTRKEFNDNFAL